MIFRYLAAVQRYLTEPQLQQYSFTTVSYTHLDVYKRQVILLYAKNAINYPYSTVILFHEINASVFQPFIHYGILSHEIEPAGSQPPAPMKRHTWNSNHPDFLLLFPAAKFGRQPIPRLQSGNRLFGIAWWKARPRSVGCFFLLRIAPAAVSYTHLDVYKRQFSLLPYRQAM